ncbi:unnamed protein product, partial [Prorocentrum cordatum]
RWQGGALEAQRGAPALKASSLEACCSVFGRRSARGLGPGPVVDGVSLRRELLIDRWLDWPVGFRTEVVSASANRTALGSGWRRSPTGDAAVIGSAYGGDALEGWGAEASLLHLEALLDSPGELTFSVEASPDSAWGLQASVLANGTAPWGLRLVAEEGGRRTLRAPLSAGAVRLTWVWRHAADVEGTGAGLAVSGIKLLNVSVTHVQGAGVRGCEPCPAGSAAGEGDGGLLCRPCPAGTTSDGAGSACAPCPPGTAARSGEGSCRPCGGGLRSGAGAAHCEPEGTLQKDARQWNGSALVGAWRLSGMVAIEIETYNMLTMDSLLPTTTRLDSRTGQIQTQMSEVQRTDQRLSETMDKCGKDVRDMKTDLDRQVTLLIELTMLTRANSESVAS